MKKLKEEFTWKMPGEFTVDDEPDIKHKVWSICEKAGTNVDKVEATNIMVGVKWQDYEKYN